MDKRTRYPVEVRERAVRMVFEHGPEYDSQYAAIRSIADKFGMSPETLRLWVRRAETDEGLRPGLTTDERAHMKELERENRELRRANEILKSAAVSSTGQRNNILKLRCRGPKVQRLSWTGVELPSDLVELFL